jgi:hypothetical protein
MLRQIFGNEQVQSIVNDHPMPALLLQACDALASRQSKAAIESEMLANCGICGVTGSWRVEQLKIEWSKTFQEGSDQKEQVYTHCLRLPPGMTSIPTQDDPLAMVDTFCQSLSKTTLTLTSSEFQQAVKPPLERSIVPV